MIIHRYLGVLLVVVGATLDAGAGTIPNREAPVLAMVGFTNPVLDVNQLNWMFDRALTQVERVVAAPKEKAQPKVWPIKQKNIIGLPKESYLNIPIPMALKVYNHAFQDFTSHPKLTDRYDREILKYAALYHLDPRLIKAVIAAESGFHERARSPKGARGLMQVVPRTASYFGVSSSQLFFGADNILAGSAYLASLFGHILKQLGLQGASLEDIPSWVIERVIAAYNAGPRFLHNRKLYRSTRNYIKKVMIFYRSPVSEIRNAPQLSSLAQLLAKL
jgi:hypothetical protein